LHLALFEQPGKDNFFSSLLAPKGFGLDQSFHV